MIFYEGSITDVAGIQVGHAQDEEARTGVTVIRYNPGATGAVDVRGAAPATQETDLLRPEASVERVHAVVLCGGSAYGLDAACGVRIELESQGIGLEVLPNIRVPIVCAAALFDLGVGRSDIRPDAAMGRAACACASGHVTQGQVGAGCGCTVGKLTSPSLGGVGTASLRLSDGTVVAALAAVNAAGNVYGPDDPISFTEFSQGFSLNTTLAVVATDAKLTKAQALRLAQCAHDGFARAISPVHTPIDGDVAFALSTGTCDTPINMIALCAAAAEVTARAIRNGVYTQ